MRSTLLALTEAAERGDQSAAQILEMAKSLNLEVVVEGVEIDHQANYFVSSEEQHIHGQGWLYGRLVSAEEFHAQLANDWTKASPPGDSAASLNGGVLPFPMPVPILASSRLEA